MSGTDDWYRELHEAKCQSKRRFHSAQQARNQADYENLRRGVVLFTYKCPVCRKFHLTRSDPRDHDYRQFEKATWKAFTGGLITKEEREAALRAYKRKQR